jgi:hypothetical protein
MIVTMLTVHQSGAIDRKEFFAASALELDLLPILRRVHFLPNTGYVFMHEEFKPVGKNPLWGYGLSCNTRTSCPMGQNFTKNPHLGGLL